jgi:hypothetical protein
MTHGPKHGVFRDTFSSVALVNYKIVALNSHTRIIRINKKKCHNIVQSDRKVISYIHSEADKDSGRFKVIRRTAFNSLIVIARMNLYAMFLCEMQIDSPTFETSRSVC